MKVIEDEVLVQELSRVAVTGGAGFIGSHVVDAFAEEAEVVVIDDFSTGSVKNLMPRKHGVKVIRRGLRDRSALRKSFKGCEIVVHLAAKTSVPESVKFPDVYLRANVRGTLNVLEAARKAGVRRVIAASSAAVYGDDPTLPKREDMVPSPASPYAASKLATEAYTLAYGELGVEGAVLRVFNVYGPRQPYRSTYASVVPRFARAVLSNKPLTIFGDGEQTRDFIFVLDAARAFVLAARMDLPENCILNIATGSPTSVNRLAHAFGAAIGKDAPRVYRPPRPGDVKHSYADVEKAKRVLGFEAEWDIVRGIKETLRWFSGAR